MKLKASGFLARNDVGSQCLQSFGFKTIWLSIPTSKLLALNASGAEETGHLN